MFNVVSPWPPQRNGIADYVYEIAKYSATPQTIVTRAMDPKPCGGDVRILNDADRDAVAALEQGPNLYHFGNNPDHVFMAPLFLRYPGTVVIHDTTLHYLTELVDNLIPGFFSAQLAEELPELAPRFEVLWRQTGMKRAIEHREIKLLGWLKEARQVIVHSEFAARAVGPYFENADIHVLPHFAYQASYGPSQLAKKRAAARRQLKFGDDVLVLSTVGFVTANKQYGEILRAIAQLPASLRNRVRYVVAGELRPKEYDIRGAIHALGLCDNVLLAGFSSESEMENILLASDLVFNLRYPTFGESSGSVARALGLGCALAVTDAGSYGELPDSICHKVSARADCGQQIAALIKATIEDVRGNADRGRAAFRYARTILDPARLAARYDQILLQSDRAR